MKRPLRIAITTGDIDGIGFEIAAKALAKVGPQKDIQFFLFRSPKANKRDLLRIKNTFRVVSYASWPEALSHSFASHKELCEINSSLSPAVWVETAAKAATLREIDAIVTAPLSKTSIRDAGMKDLGHTDILKRVTKISDLFMGFLGSTFSVVLTTDHVPLGRVEALLTPEKIVKAVIAAKRLSTLLPKKQMARPIALVGFNPHAGEQGLIGDTEVNSHIPAIELAKKKKLNVEGPLAPDTCFYSKNFEKYSVFVASYHDQGLIPFKTLQSRDANVHITLGLPFVRTSVDHGTAKDLFGKNNADPNSMTKALRLAIQLCKTEASV